MAGAAGIEPANHGIKTRCLTTWLRPNLSAAYFIELTFNLQRVVRDVRRPLYEMHLGATTSSDEQLFVLQLKFAGFDPHRPNAMDFT